MQVIPDPAGSVYVWLNQVSCISAGFCEVVGGYRKAGSNFSLTKGWNGTGWSAQPAIPEGLAGDPASVTVR